MRDEQPLDRVLRDEGGDLVFLEAGLQLVDQVHHHCAVVVLARALVLLPLGVLLAATWARVSQVNAAVLAIKFRHLNYNQLWA